MTLLDSSTLSAARRVRPVLAATLTTLALALVLGTAASAAGPVTLSFASDDNHDGPTFFTDQPLDIFDGGSFSADGAVDVDLIVDLNDNPDGGLVTFQARMRFEGSLRDYKLTQCGNFWIHSWKAKGTVFFFQRNSAVFNPLLTIDYENALVTSFSPARTTLGQTMTIQTSERVDPAILFRPDTLLVGVGVTPADVASLENFAFTLTEIRDTNLVPFPRVDPNTGQFLDKWIAEGSFSAGGRQ